MKKFLVTGGAGFIGTNLCKALLSSGNEVIAVDNFITSTGNNLQIFSDNPRYAFIKHDIVKPFSGKLLKKMERVTGIYHLACPTGVPNVVKLSEEMLMTCSIGTRNVLELARHVGAAFLLTSSSEVYGNPMVFPQTEEYTGNVDPVGIRSPYEEGKRFSESLVKMYVNKYGFDGKIVRIFNTYGPNMSFGDTRVIPRFFCQLKLRRSITVEGDGAQTRTFCYVDDLVNGLMLVMKKGKKGEVYNLGSDSEITIRRLAELFLKTSNGKSTIKFIPRPKHDHQRRQPSLKKIQQLGWRPKIFLEEGLLKTMESFEKERDK